MIHQNFECDFYFIRHGESESNAAPGYMAGANFDAPLTTKGYAQARLLGERLHEDGITFDRVYSSSLIRTTQTAQTMLDAMGEADRSFPRIDAIIEQQMPGWRGVRTEDALTPELLAYMRTKAASSFRRTASRSRWYSDASPTGLRMRSCTTRSHQHGTIPAHRYCRARHRHKVSDAYIMNFDEHYIWKMSLENTSISRFRFNHAGWLPISINDTAHLRGLNNGTFSYTELSEALV